MDRGYSGQNPEPLGLTGKILSNNDLELAGFPATPYGRAMIGWVGCGRQGQMSHGWVEQLWITSLGKWQWLGNCTTNRSIIALTWA